MKIVNKGLGKGLDALIKPDFYETNNKDSEVGTISINKVVPNPNQPRSKFDEQKIDELSKSIAAQGVLQPILVKKNDNEEFVIIAGERRWRASIRAGLKKIPAIIREFSEAEALAIALIENLQREDLNVIEQARALERLKNELQVNQEELADKIGKSRSHLANILRLLNLPDFVQEKVINQELSAGHAKCLLGLKDKNLIEDLVNEIIQKKMSVRALENLIKKINDGQVLKKKNIKTDSDLGVKMQSLIKEKVNQELKVKFKGTKEKGQLVINYSNENQLNDVLRLLG